MRSKVKLSLIANETARRTTFKKRKRGIMKKINELTTLCGVEACAVVFSQFDPNPEVWPSTVGAQEVYSRFLDMPVLDRTKKMLDHKSFLWERIKKAQEQTKKIYSDNREAEVREFMFECLAGRKTVENQNYDPRDLRDLTSCIENYDKAVDRRIEVLKRNGESSSLVPVADAAPPLVADADADAHAAAAAETARTRLYDRIRQYHNMEMQQIQNLRGQVTYQSHANSYDHIHQNMIQQEPVHDYQAPVSFYGENQYRFFGMDPNQLVNQYPNQQQSFMDQLMMAHHGLMESVEERASGTYMDGNYYRYQQPPTTGHMPSITTATGYMPSITTVATGHMPSISTPTSTTDITAASATTPTTDDTADASAVNINNNVWPTRFGFE
ncbi:unnamed protein product [Thlaspi arvense]|uniref:MADS-box domain-containing protein n=1 Tax=Thlaspi arvense TaxID=13288 RepID=A0AAU9RKE0_THLAR|nr:unnamed protein product [Thlaspi arvense]